MDCKACQAPLSLTVSRSLLKFMSVDLVIPSNHLILCCFLLLLPSIFPSIRVFSNESVLRMRWPKYWSFSFSISPSKEYSGLILLRIDWIGLLEVQGILNSFSDTIPKLGTTQMTTNRWMHQQSSHQPISLLKNATTWRNLNYHSTQKGLYYMILFIWNSRRAKTDLQWQKLV